MQAELAYGEVIVGGHSSGGGLVIRFAMPDEVLTGPYGDTATTSYSFWLNTGFAPRSDYRSDLAALQMPFLRIAEQ